MFFTECDMLDIRLHELYESVHKFILVESPFTHQGAPKPLYYAENKKRFEQFNDKIIHVVEDFHDTAPYSWAREFAQRNRALVELEKLNPDGMDAAIVSDLDEIPRASDLPGLYSYFVNVEPEVTYFHMRFYYYYLNCDFSHLVWERGYVAPYCVLKGLSLNQLRSAHSILPRILPVLGKNEIVPRSHLTDAERARDKRQHFRDNTNGWHFSYVGGVDKIMEKLKAFSHTEYGIDFFCNRERILHVMADNRGIDGPDHYVIVPIDESYPKYVRDNVEHFKQIGFIKT
jgi:beta-1,4-mannosyl-glycoprotein beta-1,4-N-acetylglucosaminyltransferase